MSTDTGDLVTQRFWSRVHKTDTCWLWTGVLNRGYGTFYANGRSVKAHRFAYELLVGPIPFGLQLDHTCHTRDCGCPGGWGCAHRRCVNPAHLEPVTRRENILRGKSPSAHAAQKTHCPHGHPYDEDNTRVDYKGKRRCRICLGLYERRRRSRKSA